MNDWKDHFVQKNTCIWIRTYEQECHKKSIWLLPFLLCNCYWLNFRFSLHSIFRNLKCKMCARKTSSKSIFKTNLVEDFLNSFFFSKTATKPLLHYWTKEFSQMGKQEIPWIEKKGPCIFFSPKLKSNPSILTAATYASKCNHLYDNSWT